MSNRDKDARYEHLLQGVPFVTQQLMLQVHTSIPGIVTAYDAATRRARVQPAVHMMLSPVGDPYAPFAACEPMEKPIILDVPVIFPSAGGYTVHFPLLPDDPVLLLFSERDIDNFKQTLESDQPLSGDIMEVKHAVCIPGFVPFEDDPTVVVPPENPAGGGRLDGFTVQTNDGTTWVHLAADDIHARIVGDPVDETTYVRLTPQRIYATPDNETTYVDITPAHIVASPDAGTTYVRVQPADIDATPDSYVTRVRIQPGDIVATPDNDVTHARLRPADVDVTPDSGATLLRVTGGNVAITATTVTITGALNVTGVSTLVGNVGVTGNIGVSGTVDGVDVSTHDHTFGTQTDGTTGPPR